MSQKPAFVKVSTEFDPVSFDGALVMCETFGIGKYFAEDGYDDGERENRKVIDVRPAYTNPADDDALERILSGMGIDMWCEDDGEDNILPNVICRRPEVRAALEAAGYDAVVTEMGIILGNGQYGATILWKPETFEVLPKPDMPPFTVDIVDDGLRLSLNTPEAAWHLWERDSSLDDTSDILGHLIAETARAQGMSDICMLPAESLSSQDGTLIVGSNVEFDDYGNVVDAGAVWAIEGDKLYNAVNDLLAREPFVVPSRELSHKATLRI